jgi:Fur family zinc uptake transcriptional regulator
VSRGPSLGADFGFDCANAAMQSAHGETLDRQLHPRYIMATMTLTKPTFPAPDHDHDRCAADGILHAEQVCKLKAQKFTPIRRQVLQALLSSHRPLGAYEVIDELAKSMPRPAPITVYRALDFLIENGLVHRIESRNAYLACAHDHDATAMVAFLICERCGSVGEIPAAPVAQSLNAAARASGFAPKLSVVEITGTCAHCQKAA